MSQIKINSNTTISDVSAWAKKSDTEVVFLLNKSSGFSLATEGVALSALRNLARESIISVTVTYSAETVERYEEIGLFDSLFGIALIFACSKITTPTSQDARSALLERVWLRLRQQGGLIGHGKELSLVSREPDEPIPELLQVGGAKFPLRNEFSLVVSSIARKLGYGNSDAIYKGFMSKEEQEGLTFLYEASLNAFEHGRHELDGSIVRGVRGMLFERMSFVRYDEIGARKLTKWQESYIRRVWPDSKKSLKIVSYSVVDHGPGIHNTLPPHAGEGPWQRLCRAFDRGVTRKVVVGDIEAGVGLHNISLAAERLRALLLVKSGGLLGVADYSQPETAGGARLIPIDNEQVIGTRGTVITLMWPDISR